MSTIISKTWGREVVVVNNDEYCGKILKFIGSGGTSMHFHLKKHETFYIREGTLLVRSIDTKTGELDEMVLEAGESLEIPRLFPHSLSSYNGESVEVYEFSTHHEDSDSYRVMKFVDIPENVSDEGKQLPSS